MAPPKQPPKTTEAARAQGNKLLTDFFKRPRPGRPKRSNLPGDAIEVTTRKKKKRGPMPKAKRQQSATLAKSASLKEAPLTKVIASKVAAPRTNWAKGESKTRLDKALEEWNNHSGRSMYSNGEKRSKTHFSALVKIPYNTFKKYTTKDHAKRCKAGSQVGRKPLLPAEDQEFLADVLAQRDRANNGANPKEAIDIVQELNPDLSRPQAHNHFNRTAIKNHPRKIKPKP